MTSPAPETIEREQGKLYLSDAELIRRLGVPEKGSARCCSLRTRWPDHPRLARKPLMRTIDRTKNNVIGTMRHAVACPFIQTDGIEPCDCSPSDDAKAMTRDDILRIFAPLPPEEAEALRKYIG